MDSLLWLEYVCEGACFRSFYGVDALDFHNLAYDWE